MKQPVRRRLALDGAHAEVTLSYLEWGEPDATQVVVCVHGLTRNAHDFDTLAAELAGAGARVLAVDVAGRGHSSWLADPSHYELETYARHLDRFLARLGLSRVDWVGTSMGGLIGMALAATAAPKIRRLILNDVGPFVPKDALALIKAYLELRPTFADFAALEAHLRTIHAPFGKLSDAQWRALARSSARQDPDAWRLRYDPAISEAYGDLAADDVDLSDLWERIRVPTFVLRGAESPLLTEAVAARMATTGPKAVVETVPHVGHAPALMDPQQIAILRRWLELGG
ncbi:MAG: alpha/beta hydrolase [Geminicoccaceae bacterium]|nr:MAG: alpha/beta hydrolase [Geminicoccaceae bacterium]